MRVGGSAILNGGEKHARGAKEKKILGVVFGDENIGNERVEWL